MPAPSRIGSQNLNNAMPISFPICVLVFLAGWLSGSLFILVSLDPQGLPSLLSPLDSKFTDLQMQLRTNQISTVETVLQEGKQQTAPASVSGRLHFDSNYLGNERDSDNVRDNKQSPTDLNIQFTSSKKMEMQKAESIVGKFSSLNASNPNDKYRTTINCPEVLSCKLPYCNGL